MALPQINANGTAGRSSIVGHGGRRHSGGAGFGRRDPYIGSELALHRDRRPDAEFFNVFNHTNFTTVATTYGSANFGQVTADLRIAELVLRYRF